MKRKKRSYLKLIVDNKVLEVFPASRKLKSHDRLSRLEGCHLQPALPSEYRAYKEKLELESNRRKATFPR